MSNIEIPDVQVKEGASLMKRLSNLWKTGEGKITILFGGGMLFYLVSLLVLRFTRFSGNIEYGPVLLDRVYQGFPKQPNN